MPTRRLPLRQAPLLLAVLGVAIASPGGAAQVPAGATYGVTAGPTARLLAGSLPQLGDRAADAGDPAETLARDLRTLSDNPSDLGALTGAGRAALAIGDANAALAFYARAEEIAPRDGRIKAGLGSAMLQLEKPKEAIGLFDEATNLGVPEIDIASDRGLAWDLRGDTRRAQRDYALALRSAPDDETKRRMALSLAISGDTAGANALLDPLLRRQDRAAWRARAFILAMSGDVAKADVVARSAMSPGQVAALHPFLVRLASLRPAQKALAVNFGEMPSTGKVYSPTELAAIDGQPPIRLDSGLVPAGEPWGPRQGSGLAADAEGGDDAGPSTAPRRRPGASDGAAVAQPDVALARAEGSARAPVASRPRDERPRPMAARYVPTIAAPAAAVAPTFVAVAPPPVTVVLAAASPDQSPPAPVRMASAEASPSLSALDPAVSDGGGRTVVPPPPSPPPAPDLTKPTETPAPLDPAAQDKAVALPPVGYRLPPAKPKPAPAEPPAEDAKPKAIRPESVKAKEAPAKEPAASRGGKASAKKPEDEAKPARKAGAKASVEDTKDADEKPAKKTTAKTSTTKKDAADKDDGEDAKATGKKGSDKKRAETKDDATKADKKDVAKKDTKAAAKDKKSAANKHDDKADAKPDKHAPQRVWVQVAGGATKADLPKAWSKLKGKAPALAKGQSTYTTPLRATNRLLVGPFKTADEAQAYVNKMGKAGLSGFTFTSDKGQQVDKLSTDK